MHHPTSRIVHTTAYATPVMEHGLDREITQWVHHGGSILRPIAPWANALTTELQLVPRTRKVLKPLQKLTKWRTIQTDWHTPQVQLNVTRPLRSQKRLQQINHPHVLDPETSCWELGQTFFLCFHFLLYPVKYILLANHFFSRLLCQESITEFQGLPKVVWGIWDVVFIPWRSEMRLRCENVRSWWDGSSDRSFMGWTHWAISRSPQCSTTGVTKAVICIILSVGCCI